MKKSFKEKGAAAILPLCELVVGILLLINPSGFTKGIIMAVGVLFVLLGIKDIVGYFRAAPQTGGSGRRGLSRGLLEGAAGVFCVVNPQWFTATFPVLTMLYGVGMLVSGAVKVETAIDLLRSGREGWGWPAGGSVLSLVCAAVILSNPFGSSAVLWSFVAVSLIVEAAVDFAAIFLPKRSAANASA